MLDPNCSFSLAEAVSLATAQISYLADSNSIDALIIKGPGATFIGVRPPRPSADVDVIVSDARFGELILILKGLGWMTRPFDDTEGFPSHSETLYHPNWPCDIDVHYRFPGFEAPSDQVFIALWNERRVFSVAETMVNIPGPCGATLIQALHSLRGIWLPLHQNDYSYLKSSKFLPSLESLLDFAERTGSLGTSAPFLEETFNLSGVAAGNEPGLDWQQRTNQELPGLFRLVTILRAPLEERPRLIWRAICPSTTHLLSKDMTLDLTSESAIFRVRFIRLARFISCTPSIFWKYIVNRQSHHR